MTYLSSSSARTRVLGSRVGRALVRQGTGRRARTLLLRGELGSGKTTFVQGLARGLGARGRVASPTFVIVRRVPVSRGPFRNLFHIDAYRLSPRTNIRVLGLPELAGDPKNILVVEWPEAVQDALSHSAYEIRFAHGRRPKERLITLPKNFL